MQKFVLLTVWSSFLLFVGVSCTDSGQWTLNEEAAYALINRVIPEYADLFSVEYIPQEEGKDVFELEQVGDKIMLRGNDGVSVASALNYYLTNYAHCDYSWNGSNLKFPDPVPVVKEKVRKVTPYKYRHYFNYCTFSYTTPWWDWERWQFEIDYMALHGINMPLAMIGQNAVWDRVYRKLGFDDEDMDRFFTGPAYFMWFWAGNIDGWCGPLPQSWKESHEELQKNILARERELGMTPVLPAFTGHVPPTFKDKYPEARLRRTNWEGRFDDTYILEPDDPMFKKIGNLFMEEQIKTFGTNHLYGADTFNEMFPPSNDSIYLNNIGQAVYQSMADVDTAAVWVMQGWLFVDKQDFWQPEQIQAYLNGVPNDKMIILDLWGEEKPVWNRTDAYYGKPWIWCMLHNFGGRNMMFGNAGKLSTEPARVLNDPMAGALSGIGAVPEGIEQNPMIYSLLFDQVWREEPIVLDEWLKNYAHCRYGLRDENMERAWEILQETVYAHEGNYESAITARPTFDKDNVWAYTSIPYDPAELIDAWKYMLDSSGKFADNPCYQYDLLLVGKQVLANYATEIQQKFRMDYDTKDLDVFRRNSEEFLTLIDDMDKLMATNEAFLLGKWINDAKSWGTTEEERKLYEKNARDIVTLWGGKDAFLHDYASKQWAGLFSGFYKKRWQLFINEVEQCISQNKVYQHDMVDEQIKNWEWDWVNASESYPDEPIGNTIEISKEMYVKYANKLRAIYGVSFE